MIDWKDTTRVDRFEYELVDPNNIDSSRGNLAGVIKGSITYGYYTDTRVSASIECLDFDYLNNSLIRIHHYVDDWGYHNELGTFFVDDVTPVFSKGSFTYSLELSSLLSRISDDYLPRNYAISAKRSSSEVLSELFKEYGVDHYFTTESGSTYQNATVYEIGENVLSTAFDISDYGGCRLEIDGHGFVNVAKYVNPSERAQVTSLDQSMIIGEITETIDFYSAPNRAIVHSKKDNSVVSGVADTPSEYPTARSRRGKRVTKVYSENNLSPFSNTQASALAERYLANVYDVSVELEMDTLYLPITPGEVVGIYYNGQERNAMLKTRKLRLEPGMACSDTYKVV